MLMKLTLYSATYHIWHKPNIATSNVCTYVTYSSAILFRVWRFQWRKLSILKIYFMVIIAFVLWKLNLWDMTYCEVIIITNVNLNTRCWKIIYADLDHNDQAIAKYCQYKHYSPNTVLLPWILLTREHLHSVWHTPGTCNFYNFHQYF